MRIIKLFLILFLIPTTILAQGFENIAEEYGLDFSYTTDDYGGGVSFVDFNQDGLDDLSFATSEDEPTRFFINTGNGFIPQFDLIDNTSATKQLLWIDYNNDQLLDLYVSSDRENKLYRNNGNLEMIDVTQSSGLLFPDLESYCSTWFDYDNDGRIDLLVSHRTEDENGWVDIYRNIDNQSFEKTTSITGLLNKGESVLAMTTFDFNNDGWQDIYLAQDWEKGNLLFKNNGNGTFKDVSKSSGIDFKMNSMSATVMDINHDGWMDLYTTNTSLGTKLLVNNGDETFDEKSEYYNLDLGSVTFGAVFFDADNDTDDDLHIGGFLANYTFEDLSEEEEFKRRDNDWGFQSDDDFNNGVAIGDFNNDGYIDIVKNSVTRENLYISDNSLWQNNFDQNNYIKLKLKGSISNYLAIGAKISVHTGSAIQYKRVGCGESFSSQHSFFQHFGLGETDLIDSIVVQWPSNNVSVLTNILPNQTIIVDEPLEGCTNINACNYSPNATIDNGFCRYPDQFYNCLGCLEDSDADGVCDQLEIAGCTEYGACNFSNTATENDGSCIYIESLVISGPESYKALEEVQYSYPATDGSRYEWNITNGTILSGNQSNIVTVLWYESEKGNITIKEINESNCIGNTVSKDIEILERDSDTGKGISIGPVPAYAYLQVFNLNESHSYKIFNTNGSYILGGEISTLENQIDISSLSAGIYIIEFYNDISSIKFKLIKV